MPGAPEPEISITPQPLTTGTFASNIAITDNSILSVIVTELNSLANNSFTSALSYLNPSSASNATLKIILGDITPTSGATLLISNSTISYEISIPAIQGAKEILFRNIPTTFLSNFTITNKSGVTLNSTGNAAWVYVEPAATILTNPLVP